jgi:hypothetical protein
MYSYKHEYTVLLTTTTINIYIVNQLYFLYNLQCAGVTDKIIVMGVGLPCGERHELRFKTKNKRSALTFFTHLYVVNITSTVVHEFAKDICRTA